MLHEGSQGHDVVGDPSSLDLHFLHPPVFFRQIIVRLSVFRWIHIDGHADSGASSATSLDVERRLETWHLMRILSGIQPSGVLHIGNYFGMMRPAIALQAEGEAFYFIADYHALTSLRDPAALREKRAGSRSISSPADSIRSAPRSSANPMCRR